MLKQFTEDMMEEWFNAEARYPLFHSMHEAYAVLLEELDELWDEVRKKPHERNPETIYHELIQIAAMALRTVTDLGGEKHYGL